ncbi:MAG: zinc metallopeptidase [Verrucomicrobiales bacterium]
MIWILFIGTLLLSLLAAWRVRSNFARYSRVPVASGLTGAEAARRILHANGIQDVEVVPVPGSLSDHYDPVNKKLALSEPVYYESSVSALGVAAHECGHALQHQQAYAPLHARMALVKAQGIASQTVLWLPLLGMAGNLIPGRIVLPIIAAGWGVIMLFNLITLPVEFDASHRAGKALSGMGFIRTQEEARGVERVLKAAGWTYVAAFLTSLAYMLFYLLPLLTGRRE